MDLVDQVILWDYSVSGTISGGGDVQSFNGVYYITTDHDARFKIGPNINVVEELAHGPNITGEPPGFR